MVNRSHSSFPSLFILVVLAILILLVFTVQEWRYTGGQGVPLDDSWIHFHFARNVASGRGFSYAPGVQTPGSTSPLWVLLLAGVYVASQNVVLISKLLGFLFLLVSVWGIYRISLLVCGVRLSAFFAALFSLLAGRLFWGALSGMEIGLFTALTVWGIVFFLQYDPLSRRSYLWPLVLGLATLARPEGALLFVLAFMLTAWLLLRDREVNKDTKRLLRNIAGLGLYLLLFCALICPEVLFCLETTGRPLPNTFYAKTQGFQMGRTSLVYLVKVAYFFFRDHPLLFCFLPAGIWAFGSRMYMTASKRHILLAWFIGLPVANAIVNPITWHHGRYVMFLIPLFFLFSVHGLFVFLKWSAVRIPKLKELLLTLSLLLSFVLVFHWSGVYARNVDNINQMDVRMGHWLDSHLPPDAVVAASDVGAIAYFCDRRIIDTDGLITPEIIPYLKEMGREEGVFAYLKNEKPDFVVAFAAEFQFLTVYDDIFEPIFSLRVTRNTILGGDRMVVYKTHWPS
jgi:arabinofuranosyltransferase